MWVNSFANPCVKTEGVYAEDRHWGVGVALIYRDRSAGARARRAGRVYRWSSRSSEPVASGRRTSRGSAKCTSSSITSCSATW